MRRKRVLIAGLVCGLVCALCVFLYLQLVTGRVEQARADALERYGGEQLEVCVAGRDINAGETLGEADVARQLWLVDLLPDGCVTDAKDVLGKKATSLILQGEVLSQRRFEDAGIALNVPAGMAAVSLPAKEVEAVGGAIQAGMLVDVYATGATTTALIAEDALVVTTSNAGKTLLSGGSTSQWITLAVRPELVESLVCAAQTQDLYFVLPPSGVLTAQPDAALPTKSAAEGNAQSMVDGQVANNGEGFDPAASQAAGDNAPAGVLLYRTDGLTGDAVSDEAVQPVPQDYAAVGSGADDGLASGLSGEGVSEMAAEGGAW